MYFQSEGLLNKWSIVKMIPRWFGVKEVALAVKSLTIIANYLHLNELFRLLRFNLQQSSSEHLTFMSLMYNTHSPEELCFLLHNTHSKGVECSFPKIPIYGHLGLFTVTLKRSFIIKLVPTMIDQIIAQRQSFIYVCIFIQSKSNKLVLFNL